MSQSPRVSPEPFAGEIATLREPRLLHPGPVFEDLGRVLANTSGLWDGLRGRRLFITGGTGFFGTWLLHAFVWAEETHGLNAKAVVLTRDPQAFLAKVPHLAAHPAVTLHQGDICDFDFPPGEFSAVIHAAREAYHLSKGVDRALVVDRDMRGTRRVLEFARQRGCEEVLLTTSGAVYGPQPAELSHVAEEYGGGPETTNPNSCHNHGKRLMEYLGAVYADTYGLKIKIARCFTFLGPYLPTNVNYAAGSFISDGLAGGPIIVQGDGTPCRSYLYAADLAVWLWTILYRGKTCRPYNVGSEETLSIGELAATVADCFTPRREVRILKTPVPGQPAQRYVPSTRRAREELGLRQITPLDVAIRRTIAFHQHCRQTCQASHEDA